MRPAEENRPDPDELLSRIGGEGAKTRGKLKIFFGMAAGVGKTFEMLRDAQKAKSEGIDVWIGYLETHNRKETEAQAEGLSIIPRKRSKYKSVDLEEMDLDTILEKKPDLVLIDELAHTNVPGSRHPKRYQDVLEILGQGINVYSTLNVQHLESRAGIVEEISGAPVSERVPDSILEIADEVELIDLVPDDLIKRLKEGKVYPSDKVPQALHSFFKIPNLTALRELSLNFTSKLVDRELSRLEPTKDSKLSDKILVAVSSSPQAANLIRYAKRIAFGLKCPWVAVHVDDGNVLDSQEKDLLKENLGLARELGAEILNFSDGDPVLGIVRAINRTKATHVVIGRSGKSKLSRILKGGSFIDKLSEQPGDFQILLAPTEIAKDKPKLRFGFFTKETRSKPIQYFLSFLALLGITSFNLLLNIFAGYWSIGLIYLFFIMFVSLFAGRGPVLVTASLSAIFWNFLFIPPKFTFYIEKVEDWMMFGTYFILALVLGILTTRLRDREEALQTGEEALSGLYRLSVALSKTHSLDEIASVAVETIGDTFQSSVLILLSDQDSLLSRIPHPKSGFKPDMKESALAAWTFQNRKPSGKDTDTVPMSKGLYLPLLTPGGCFGVIGLDREHKDSLELEEETLLFSMLNQIALALERIQLLGIRANAKLVEESEKFYSALFNSVSHDFRTPLTVIRASLDLLEIGDGKNEKEKSDLFSEIRIAYKKLDRLVGDLLDMSRLESGRLMLDLQWEDPVDLINETARIAEYEKGEHILSVQSDESMPLVRMDRRLMIQVLIHLLQNAFLHTEKNSTVIVRASVPKDHLLLTVEDNGVGIPPGQEEKIFEKFTKISGSIQGTGLGLSICKGLVEAQGGKIWAENKQEGGARFLIRIPVLTFPPLEDSIV
ncbi:sensor histidine kinase KdpD [Leptospira selangorensis]|uniref:histidine kinase n=1 Tax=Leptospira selangorensis TaxID=2484982 RepID=A0A5F2C2B6_9LEPT|nr:sensor histidine kinase KdpD [Leptospira selangorensis]TGM16961.1 sensor histidine kinase KdpD [Leptospira selangorensis]TGM21299.1 sensor histidine kinase KdpD [Leptospira selangorensis]